MLVHDWLRIMDWPVCDSLSHSPQTWWRLVYKVPRLTSLAIYCDREDVESLCCGELIGGLKCRSTFE